MAADVSLAVVTDTRQLSRESRLLTPQQVDDFLAGCEPVWMDEERNDDQVIITPRLCFG